MKPTQYNFRIDDKVIITMLLVSILAFGITAFRFKNDKPCDATDFKITANEFKTGQIIFFNGLSARHAESWEWTYGDKSGADTRSGPIASHIYTLPGEYTITLKVNGKCKAIKTITIQNAVQERIERILPSVQWPAEPVNTGQPVLFRDNTNGANRWEWFIGEGKQSARYVTREAPHTFTEAGDIPVQLIINGDETMIQRRTIKVIGAPKEKKGDGNDAYKPPRRKAGGINDDPVTPPIDDNPPPPPPPKIKITLPTQAEFENIFKGMITGNTGADDVQRYLCASSAITFNGDAVSLAECVSRLREVNKLRRLRVFKLNIMVSGSTNCVSGINLTVKKTLL